MLNPSNCDFLFVGFDCALRTLGWSILGYTPSIITANRDKSTSALRNARDVIQLFGSGVYDVLGANIDSTSDSDRARALARALDNIIPRDFPISRAYVIIERQPRKRNAFCGGAVRTATACVESQLVYHFSVTRAAKYVYLISAGKKNHIARELLHEPMARTYAERKKQTRRAFVHLAGVFNFDTCANRLDYKHIRADMADACLQIVAAIFICARDIR
ncbi:MAG: hypothetical protein WC919_07595 [Candidatus Paceibacterota bacterium]|jgi:hypothetical protein